MPVQESERAAEQIDARGDDRRTHAVVVEHQRLDEVIEVALVIRDVDDAAGACRALRDVDVFVDAFDLAQDRIERMFQGTVDRISLRRPQLVEVGVDALASLELRLPVAPTQVPRHLVARENCLGDVVEHDPRTISGPLVFLNPFSAPELLISCNDVCLISRLELAHYGLGEFRR